MWGGGTHGGGCDRRTKRSREELPHLRGQGQKPGGPHDRKVAAKRSYPAFEVRGGDERSYPASEVRGGDREEIPQERGQGRWPRGDTPQTRPGAVARKTGPMSKEQWGVQEGLEELSHVEGQEGRQ